MFLTFLALESLQEHKLPLWSQKLTANTCKIGHHFHNVQLIYILFRCEYVFVPEGSSGTTGGGARQSDTG